MSNPVTYKVNHHKRKFRILSIFKFLFKFIIKTILILIILFLIASIIAVIFAYMYLKNIYVGVDEEFNKLIRGINTEYSNSIVMDIDGQVLAVLNADEKRQIITLNDMPYYLPKAYIAIEDERFYKHKGVDLKRTANAIITYLKNDGQSSFGGSSITQQLIKNVTNNREITIDRKIKEWILAYKLEQTLSKDQILEKYLNIIFVGSDVYGVELGAEYYFSKSASELTIAESAFLAGITHSPNLYNPFGDSDNTQIIKSRTKTVLYKMLELGFITPKDYSKAVFEVDEGLSFEEGNNVQTVYSYHTDAALNQIIQDFSETYNISTALAKSYVYSNGLKIYTTQNSQIQYIMEQEMSDEKYIIPSKIHENETTQAAMVLIDHSNGFVLACVGGLGEKNVARGLNRATQSTRQTGSAMKPLSVLGPALQEGIIKDTSVYNDSRTTFRLKNGTTYSPKNFGSYRGYITVRQALETSQNIPFVRIMEKLTPEKSREYLENMGITTLTENDYDLSLAIGGLDKGISPLEMAGAYATIANNGVYIKPTFYTKVLDSNDNVILEANQPTTVVYSEEVAYQLKDLLTQPVKGSRGTAKFCAIDGIDVAAKTGTTDYDYDRWLCGFTPYYTAATWYGYDYNETIKFSGSNPAGLIWIGVMSKVHEGLEGATFK